MTEKNFQTAVQYGSIVLGISVIFNVYVVMHYVEVYRDAMRSRGASSATGVARAGHPGPSSGLRRAGQYGPADRTDIQASPGSQRIGGGCCGWLGSQTRATMRGIR